jgi:hypothetical protein
MAHSDEVGLSVAVQLADRDCLGLGCGYEATLGPKPTAALVREHDNAAAVGRRVRDRKVRLAVGRQVPNCDREGHVVLASGCEVPRGPKAAVAAVHEYRDARTVGVGNRQV